MRDKTIRLEIEILARGEYDLHNICAYGCPYLDSMNKCELFHVSLELRAAGWHRNWRCIEAERKTR